VYGRDGIRNVTYTLLKQIEIILREGIGLGDDGDKVDPRTETFHDLNVKRLQPTRVKTCKIRKCLKRKNITCVP
jgi:hypothetical protein